MDSKQALAEGRAKADAYWATIPDDVTIADAVGMDYSPQRNLVLRKALGIRFPGRTIVQMTQADWIQVLAPKKAKAEWHARQLREGLPDGWSVSVKRTSDGWFVSAIG